MLKKFGAKINISGKTVNVEKSRLNGIDINCENIPDLAQIIAVVAAYAKGKTVISGIERLKFKESDRIIAITDMLTAAGIKHACNGEKLEIFGGKVHGGEFDSKNDHRTAMSCAILAAGADGDSIIACAEAVAKSYPDFYEDYKAIGGKADVVI